MPRPYVPTVPAWYPTGPMVPELLSRAATALLEQAAEPGYEAIRSDGRGLAAFPNIAGLTGGYVDCQESSLATEPALWLTVRGFNETSMATVQLSCADAHELASQLHILAANHYQKT